MAENGLLLRNLFELAQSSDEQTFLDARAEYMLENEPNVLIDISSSPEVQVHSGSDMDVITFNFYGKRDSQRFELENYESKTVEFQTESSATKRSVVLHEIPGAPGEYGCALESMEVFLDFAVYLQNLFDIPVYEIDIKADQAHHLPRIYSVEVFRECEDFTVSGGTLSSEEMRQVLEFREPCISMCAPEPGFELDEPISMEYFQIHDAHWFKGPMLMQLDCETVLIGSLQLQNAHINAFLLHWMSSSNRKLRSMELYKECREFESAGEFSNFWNVKKNCNEEKFDLSRITEGLSSVEDPDANTNLENSLCFKRPTDDVLIIVQIQCHQEYRSKCILRIKS